MRSRAVLLMAVEEVANVDQWSVVRLTVKLRG
jgi:hypothetical protein